MKIAVIIAAVVIMWFCPVCISAESTDAAAVGEELGIDTSSLGDSLSPDVRQQLEDNNITPDSTEEIMSVTAADVFRYIVQETKDRIKYPLKVFTTLLCIIIVNAAVCGFGDCMSNKQLERIYNTVTALIAASVISAPVSECVSMTTETLRSGAEFMVCYIPVFSGIAASAGSVTPALAYNTALMLLCEGAVWVSSEYVMPVLSVCMALGITEAVNPSFKLTSVTEGVSKAVKFGLGFVMTIFIGLLSLQGIIGTSADTLGIKAAKYLASNFIPVVGGAVADAYSTIRSSLGILKGGTGFFGIAAIFFMVTPVIVHVALMRLVFVCSEVVCDMFSFGSLRIIIRNTSSVLSMMLSLVICFAMMLIISTALLMSMGLNIY